MTTTTPPLVDPETLDRLRRYDLITWLVPRFRDSLPGLTAGLLDAVGAGDRAAIRTSAHHYRGIASQMGAAALADLVGAIEAAAVDGGPCDASGLAELTRRTLDAYADVG